MTPHRAGVECKAQPDALSDALWDWLDDPNGHEFIEFLEDRGLTVTPIEAE